MPLTKPSQQLQRELKEAAALLKWSADMTQAAVKLSEAEYAEEVATGRIIRDTEKQG